MKSREENPYRRLVDPRDLKKFAEELLPGEIGEGVRAISTEVQGYDVCWRCIFSSELAMQQDKAALEEVASKLQAIFYWHAKVNREYLVNENEPMQHLQQLLFLRRET